MIAVEIRRVIDELSEHLGVTIDERDVSEPLDVDTSLRFDIDSIELIKTNQHDVHRVQLDIMVLVSRSRNDAALYAAELSARVMRDFKNHVCPRGVVLGNESYAVSTADFEATPYVMRVVELAFDYEHEVHDESV